MGSIWDNLQNVVEDFKLGLGATVADVQGLERSVRSATDFGMSEAFAPMNEQVRGFAGWLDSTRAGEAVTRGMKAVQETGADYGIPAGPMMGLTSSEAGKKLWYATRKMLQEKGLNWKTPPAEAERILGQPTLDRLFSMTQKESEPRKAFEALFTHPAVEDASLFIPRTRIELGPRSGTEYLPKYINKHAGWADSLSGATGRAPEIAINPKRLGNLKNFDPFDTAVHEAGHVVHGQMNIPYTSNPTTTSTVGSRLGFATKEGFAEGFQRSVFPGDLAAAAWARAYLVDPNELSLHSLARDFGQTVAGSLKRGSVFKTKDVDTELTRLFNLYFQGTP